MQANYRRIFHLLAGPWWTVTLHGKLLPLGVLFNGAFDVLAGLYLVPELS